MELWGNTKNLEATENKPLGNIRKTLEVQSPSEYGEEYGAKAPST